MKRKLMLVMIISLIVSSLTIGNAYAYRSDNYDLSSVSTPHASTAAYYQTNIGYTAYPHTDDYASSAHSRLGSDYVFYYDGHAAPGEIVFNGNTITETNGVYDIEDYYSLDQMLLAVYCACNTGNGGSHGNFLDGTNKGINCCVGWTTEIYSRQSGTWIDRFWDNMQVDCVRYSAANADSWTWFCYLGNMGNMNYWTTSGDSYQVIY